MMEWSWKHTELRDPLGPLHLCSSMFLLSEDTDVFKSSGGVMHLNSATLLSQRKGVHSEVTGGGGGSDPLASIMCVGMPEVITTLPPPLLPFPSILRGRCRFCLCCIATSPNSLASGRLAVAVSRSPPFHQCAIMN